MTTPRAEIQPELWVSDGPAAVAFYVRAFGAVVEHRVSGPGDLDVVAQLAVGDARFWVSTAAEDLRPVGTWPPATQPAARELG